jgi:8-oxo-dGTP pyrophosphatase MutT (NUDIX family)
LVPKLITYVLLKDETNFYLQRKQKEPYAGLINMIGGKVHVGESTIEAARREVLEKTTYKPKNLTLLSIAEIRISQNSNLLSHAIAYVYGAMIGEDAKKLQDCIKIPQEATADYKDLAPDFIRIITEINNSETLCVLNMAIDFVQ